MSTPDSTHCDAFDAHLEDLLEGVLPEAERVGLRAHAAECARCGALLADIEGIVTNAATLPLLEPSRDLWPEIAARIDANVVPMSDARFGRAASSASPRRTYTTRQLAAAAVALITVSSGATWLLAHRTASPAAPAMASASQGASSNATASQPPSDNSGQAEANVASEEPNGANGAVVASVRAAERSGTDLVAGYRPDASERTYEREIVSLRRIVDERLGDLDSATVVVIERNLAIIDKAIADSRAALARDPKSGFLSTQLDRALEMKLTTLRRVALL